MKTFMASPATIDRKWYVVDATDMTLGRLASEVANFYIKALPHALHLFLIRVSIKRKEQTNLYTTYRYR